MLDRIVRWLFGNSGSTLLGEERQSLVLLIALFTVSITLALLAGTISVMASLKFNYYLYLKLNKNLD